MESIVAQAAAAAVMLSAQASPLYDPQRIVLELEPETPLSALESLTRFVDVELERALPELNVYVVRAEPGEVENALALLARSPFVASAERERIVSSSSAHALPQFLSPKHPGPAPASPKQHRPATPLPHPPAAVPGPVAASGPKML